MAELPTSLAHQGMVYTFYSYKGGVGRSMALANVGVTLALEGKKVLLVDWDLEAPGLETYFHTPMRLTRDGSQTPGVVDLLEAQARSEPLDWHNCLQRAAFLNSSLHLISAGRRTEDYLKRVQHLNWDALYKEHDIGRYIDALRNQWRDEYDFVLIDSRTGVTDIGDICTVLLPDVLVLLFVTNQQNLDGIRNVYDRACRAHQNLPVDRSKLIAIPVLSRDERDKEYNLSIAWQRMAAQKFGDMYADWLPKGVTADDALNRLFIPYVSGWSFGEALPMLEQERERSDPSSIGAAYTRLATLIESGLNWSTLVEVKATESDAAGTRQQLAAVRDELKIAEERQLETARAAEEARLVNQRLAAQMEEQRLALADAFAVARRRRRQTFWLGVAVAAIAVTSTSAALVTYWLRTKVGVNQASISARLSEKSPTVRAVALDELRMLGPESRAHEATVLRLLHDPDPEVRRTAVHTTTALGISPSDHVEAFEMLLNDKDPKVVQQALKAIAFQGAPEPTFIRTVAALLTSPVAGIRAEAVTTLSKMGEIAPSHSEQLVRLLSDPYSKVRLAAAKAIPKLQRNGSDYYEKVGALRSDSDEEVRAAAAETLASMGQAAGLASFLDDPSASIRGRAMLALGRLGPEASRFTPKIAVLLRDADMSVRMRAIEALSQLGSEATPYASEIVARLSDPDWQVRLRAVTALAELSRTTPGLVEPIKRAQSDENGVVRQEAIRVLPFIHRKEPIPKR